MSIQKTWTPDEVKYLEANFQNSENHILATHLGRSIPSITAKAKCCGLTKCPEVAHQLRVSAGIKARKKSSARPQVYIKDGRLRFVKSLSGHPSFDEYRRVSQIYRMDLLLRTVSQNVKEVTSCLLSIPSLF